MSEYGKNEHSTWQQLEHQALCAIQDAETQDQLEQLRVSLLGKKGRVTLLLGQLGDMSPDERREKGPLINGIRNRLQHAFTARKDTLRQDAIRSRLERERIDVSLPVQPGPLSRGRIHPINHVIDEVCAIFEHMGFSIAEGNDIETDYYNFTALNFPEDHPARDMHDSFFLDAPSTTEPLLLRTHTSPVQIRTMETVGPPLRLIAPGRTYRRDSDQTHTPMFHQLEGLVVDENIHLGHMKGVLETFCRLFFEKEDLVMRFRPSFFPFTEPSLEMDLRYGHADGRIALDQGNDWIEILGCGMVHPNVLRNCRIDPDVYSGFAWGMGLDRVAMLKYGMPDLRSFFESDVRWLDHYGFRPFFRLANIGTGTAR